MASRLQLQTLLEEILGSNNIYYQPPETIRMQYPAIVYSLNSIDNNNADDAPYIQSRSYEIILIERDPDSETINKLSRLPMCRFNRHYKADNLNHYVFTLYY